MEPFYDTNLPGATSPKLFLFYEYSKPVLSSDSAGDSGVRRVYDTCCPRRRADSVGKTTCSASCSFRRVG
jgi:hypothetical protein